jgi:hypothetical protein
MRHHKAAFAEKHVEVVFVSSTLASTEGARLASAYSAKRSARLTHNLELRDFLSDNDHY